VLQSFGNCTVSSEAHVLQKAFAVKHLCSTVGSFSYKIIQSTHQNKTSSGKSSLTLLSHRAQTSSLLAMPTACMPITLSHELLGGEETLWLLPVKSKSQILCGMKKCTESSLCTLPIAVAQNKALSAWFRPSS